MPTQRREDSRRQAETGPVGVRHERDGTYRYVLTVGNQMVVSRETYSTEAEAAQAGETARQSM